MPEQHTWRELRPVDLPSAVLAVTQHGDDLWLGGPGGVVTTGSTSSTRAPLTSVGAVRTVGPWLIAGGAEGLARRLLTDPDSPWETAEVKGTRSPIAAIEACPQGDSYEDVVLVAATLGDGVLRSEDLGRTWQPANYGLEELDVSGFAAAPDGTLFAATANGVFRSRAGIRAWKRCAGTENVAVAAVVRARAGQLVAASEVGDILRSDDDGDGDGDGDGATFTPAGTVPAPVTALVADDDTVIVGTAGAGIWRSLDNGTSWQRAADDTCARQVYCFSRTTGVGALRAGTENGLATSDDNGTTWRPETAPSTHDLDRVFLLHGRPLLAGQLSGAVRLDADDTWRPLTGAPFPLTCVAVTPDDSIVGSGPDGLYQWADQGWQQVVSGDKGQVGRIAFRADGTGWATHATTGEHLLRTRDSGATWELLSTPFGVLAPTAVHTVDDVVVVLTFDHRHNALRVWASHDDGTTWTREDQPSAGSPGLAAVRAETERLHALDELPGAMLSTLRENEVIDVVERGDLLCVLLCGGRVWFRNGR